MSGKMYVIKISEDDLRQAMSGLKVRAVMYRNAQQFHNEGYCDALDGEMADAADEQEAESIAMKYEAIIADIDSQITRQDFMEEEIDGYFKNMGGQTPDNTGGK